MSSPMTLQEAADSLGVHYMTAYRYVRLGLLDAQKVGGTWQVSEAALEAFRDERNEKASDGAERSGRGARAPWSERFEARLIAGDARGAWGVVEAAMAAGHDLDAVYLEVLTPAMVSIGDRWSRGELDVAIEHRASGIAMRVIGRLGHRFVRRGRSRGVVVVGNPAGEFHALPTAIISDLLRMRGWEVSDLGANVPIGSFLFALRSEPDVKAVGLSVTHPDHLESLRATCAAIREELPEVKIVVGGGAVGDGEGVLDLGADGFARSGAGMHDLLDAWFPLSRSNVRDGGLVAGD